MANHKHISKIVIALTTVAVLICFLAVGYSDTLACSLGGLGIKMEYESRLFDTDEVMSINITIDEDDWNTMLDNAMSEEYCVCDVEINGETVHNVGIRPKGNTSLMSIAMDDTVNRYSLKLEFDHFNEGQTIFGLDKLILNNNFADATNMKEAIVYDMYRFLGADASLYNYAELYINGEYWGVYLALEGVEQSFMLRNFGTQDGELYKPEPMGGPGGPGGGMPPPPEGFDPENMPPPPGAEGFDPNNMPPPPPGGEGGPPGMGGSGADLNYSDDDLESYSTIWESEITGTGEADHRRVVTAIKNINEGTDLEKYLDIDNILRYMAVHEFTVNMDSLSGNMAHNYYLYEYNGQLNIFPWDYNFALGGMPMFGGDGATGVINDAIDTPFDGTEFFDAILENEEYMEIYHSYLDQLANEYVMGGRFDETYNRIRSQIDDLVKTDPTAFYTYEEYEAAADTLCNTVRLRAESIKGQLDGTIPSTDEAQEQDKSALIDASDLDLSVMGMMGGPGGPGGPGPAALVNEGETIPADDQGNMPPPPDGFDSDNMPPPPDGADPGNMPPPPQGDNATPDGQGRVLGERRDPPPGGFPGEAEQSGNPVSIANVGILVVCLAAATVTTVVINKKVHRR